MSINSFSRRGIAPVATALATLIAATQSGEAQVQDPSAGVTLIRRCLIEYERNTPVGSPIFSTLRECAVEPGAAVKAGQVLGKLQDQDVQAEIKLREAEAASDIDVRLNKAKSARTQAKAARTATLVKRNTVSQEEYTEHRLEAAAALLEVEQAEYRRKIAAIHLEIAKAQLNIRTLIAPHDGVVVSVLRRKGESVAPRDPIFQIVDTSTLRVVGQLDVTEAWRLRVGRPVRVVVEVAGADLPVEHEVFPGKLVFVDSQIDPTTRTCKIHVRVDNRANLLRAGLEAQIEIDPEPASPGETIHSANCAAAQGEG